MAAGFWTTSLSVQRLISSSVCVCVRARARARERDRETMDLANYYFIVFFWAGKETLYLYVFQSHIV
jgi:hypothetical protein